MPSSISSSKHRVPPLAYRRDAVWVAASVVVLCAALMAVSAWLDPYDLRLSPWRADVDRLELYRRNNVALWTAFELRRLPAEAFARAAYVILGDSRCRQLTSTYADERGRAVEIAGAPVLNLAFGGATLRESVEMFARFAGRFRTLRAIILCSPIDRFDNTGPSPNLDDALDQAAQPWRYLVNLNTITAFFEPLDRAGRPHAEEARWIPASPRWRQLVQGYRRTIERVSPGRFEKQLRASIDPLRHIAGPDVRLIFYLPPMVPEVEAIYARTGKLYRHILERLGTRGVVYDFALFDGVGSTFEFANPAHVLNDARPLLEDILATFEGRSALSRFAAGDRSPLASGH